MRHSNQSTSNGLPARVYIHPRCGDRIGWANHVDRPIWTKLPRKLKKRFKKEARKDYYQFCYIDAPDLKLRDIQLREVFAPRGFSLRGPHVVVDYSIHR